MYTIKFTDQGLQDVLDLPKNVKNSLKKELMSKLMTNPKANGEPLNHSLLGWYSFHYLEYRVIYKVFDDLLAVGIAGIGKHDKDAEMTSTVVWREQPRTDNWLILYFLRCVLSLRPVPKHYEG